MQYRTYENDGKRSPGNGHKLANWELQSLVRAVYADTQASVASAQQQHAHGGRQERGGG